MLLSCWNWAGSRVWRSHSSEGLAARVYLTTSLCVPLARDSWCDQEEASAGRMRRRLGIEHSGAEHVPDKPASATESLLDGRTVKDTVAAHDSKASAPGVD